MELIIKSLTYVIIMTIVSVVASKVNLKNKDIKITKEGEFCWEQKNVSKILFICGIIFSVLFIFVSSFPSNIEGITKNIVTICFIIFNFLIYVLSYIYYVKFIKITKDKIIYNLGLSTRELLYSEITKSKNNSSGDVLLYKDSKKMLTIPKDFTFAKSMLQYHKLIEKENENEFVMRVTNFYRGLSLVCCIAFLAFLVLCMSTNYLIGIIIFGIMLIVSFIDCLNQYKKKIIVSKDEIVVNSLFNNKKIKISDIVRTEIKSVNNADVIYIYSKEGLETKISMLYSNSYLLKELLKNKIK